MNVDWAFKLAAFLHRSPAFAFWPRDAKAEAERFIVACTGRGPAEFPHLEAVTAAARGLNIPPLEDMLDPDCFRSNPLAIHPLSAQALKMDFPSPPDRHNVGTGIANALETIKRDLASDSDPKRLFFALWRRLPEVLTSTESSIGKYWPVVPADPRVPSMSIWEHASAASALAGAWPDPAILIFGIGSAQQTVITARRTQDAWMGSFLLSYMSWRAIQVVVDTCGPDAIVSPSLRGQPLMDYWLSRAKKIPGLDAESNTFCQSLLVGNIPNMFTAVVPSGVAELLGKTCRRAADEAWKEISSTVRQELESTVQAAWQTDINSWRSIWERQCSKFVQSLGTFWVVCPCGGDPKTVLDAAKLARENDLWLEGTQEAIQRFREHGASPGMGAVYHVLCGFAGRAFTARKNLRDFLQEEEPGHKCSLCGRWEAVHPEYCVFSGSNPVSNRIKNDSARAEPSNPRYAHQWLGAFFSALSEIGRGPGRLKLTGRLRRGERLCSICLTKRLAMEAWLKVHFAGVIIDHHLFPSTASIATAQYRADLVEKSKENKLLADAISRYTDKVGFLLRDNGFPHPAAVTPYLQKITREDETEAFFLIDGAWLGENAFDRATLARTLGFSGDEEALQSCENARQDLIAAARDAELGSPPGYYAILAMDGDNMGDWITSQKGPDAEWLWHPTWQNQTPNWFPFRFLNPNGPAQQTALAESLKNFALHRARTVVEEDFAGKLIYAGGDDLLALFPLSHILPAIQALYAAFAGETAGYFQNDHVTLRMMGGVRTMPDGQWHKGVTASLGVVIAHHTHPLYHAMAEAQDTLKQIAKDALGRNACAIRVLRRSGQTTTAGWPMQFSGSTMILDFMATVLDHLRSGRLSSRLIYEMDRMKWACLTPGQYDPDLKAARKTELARIARRHALRPNETTISKQVCDLFKALDDPASSSPRSHPPIDAWETVVNLLLILSFIAGKDD